MSDANGANTPMDLSPMGEIEAAKLVDNYLAGFAYLSLPDPDGYHVALAKVMQRYPKWAGEYAIMQANPDNANFPVGAIVMRKWLEQIVSVHRNVAGWMSHSEQQANDRKLIEGAVAAAKRGQTYEEFKAEMASRGLPIDGARKSYVDTAPEVKQRFGITDAQWDALENLPINNSDYWAGKR